MYLKVLRAEKEIEKSITGQHVKRNKRVPEDVRKDGAHNVAEKLNYFAQNAIYLTILNTLLYGTNYNYDLTNI